MNHSEFRDTMLEALIQEALPAHPLDCRERLDVATGERVVQLWIHDYFASSEGSKIHCSVAVEWIWDSLTQARVHTCEEDVLTTLFDRSMVLPPSLPIEIRVDVTLVTAPEWGSDIAMPNEQAWHSWWTMVEHRVGPCFPDEIVELDSGRDAVYASRLKPRVQLEADTGGHMTLSRLELRAWSMVMVPRVFDDPQQEQDPALSDQLEELAERIAGARSAWKECLAELHHEGLRPS